MLHHAVCLGDGGGERSFNFGEGGSGESRWLLHGARLLVGEMQ